MLKILKSLWLLGADAAVTWREENEKWDLPGGAVVKDPPANAGDTGSSLGLERSHMLHSN